MEDTALHILYQDDQIIVVYKPAGMLVHRNAFTPGEFDNLTNLLSQQMKKPVHSVHRLDRATAGVMVFALTKAASTHFMRAFSEKQVHKEYLTIVRGLAEAEGKIDTPLAKKPTNKLQAAETLYKCLGQQTRYTPLGDFSQVEYSLLLVHPLTGRRHQIRRHLAYAHHAIIGDKKYGMSAHNQLWAEEFSLPGLMLQAYRLGFAHPETGTMMQFKSPIAPHMQAAMDEMEWAV